jgi:subtilisin family serine protease
MTSRHAPKPSTRTRAGEIARLLLIVTTIAAAAPAGAASRADGRRLPDRVAAQRLGVPQGAGSSPITSPSRMRNATGTQQVVVRLRTGSVAEADRDAAQTGGDRERARRDRKVTVDREQSDFLVRSLLAAPGTRVLARVSHVLNAVFLEVDAAALARIARDPAVARVAPVGRYEVDLSETVPYVGASAVHGLGFDGTGVRVAVLDSGIDYTHAAFGGSGDPVDFATNDPTVIEEGTFPTAKVVGGTDFVGPTWPDTPLAPDPDPLDDGPDGGHGSHVGHIIGGLGGVAPGTSLYAVKVCSSVSTSCSGVALIQGMEFAVDPDGDGDTSDHVDVVNMSLGSPYGQPFDDDLSLAVDNATALGVLTVASAGNSADKPFVTGSPAAAATALSVAQTAVPSAFLPFMQVQAPASIAGLYRTAFQPWSAPLAAEVVAPVQYGDGAGGNLDGCAAFPAGSLAGKIVLVDRGACNFTLKIKNIGGGGGAIGVIGLVAPGDPFEGGDGGDRPIGIPGFMISQADSIRIKGQLGVGVTARFAPGLGLPLVGSVVGSSSRGPQFEDFRVKPEIGAPGASVSAIYGTGTGTGPFGGTSGAAPMVTGSAALLVQARGRLAPVALKALLMNNAETDILNVGGGALAPVSRIGGGEVRVDRSLGAPAAAWDAREPTGSLGFGWIDVAEDVVRRTRTVVVRNFSGHDVEYAIGTSFRFAGDEASGAVALRTPTRIRVPARRSRTFEVVATIDSSRLGGNWMHSGSGGASGALLTANELDGYVTLDDGVHPIHLPWHVIPRKASETEAEPGALRFGADGTAISELENDGAGTAQIDVYSLLGLSGNLPQGARGAQSPTPDLRAVGVQTFPVPADFCGANPGFVLALASNTWERQAHADAPTAIEWDLDTNQDGTFDYAVFSLDLAGGALSDGRNVTWAEDLATGDASAFFFTEHAANTGNQILLVCDTQIGSPAFGQPIDASVFAVDVYFGGPGDSIEGITFAPLGERYLPFDPSTGGLFPNLDLGRRQERELNVVDSGAEGTNPSEIGLLLVTTGDRGPGNRGGATRRTEALVLPVADVAHVGALLAGRR